MSVYPDLLVTITLCNLKLKTQMLER